VAQESDQIKKHIDTERDRLEQDLQEIERRVTNAVDWREHFNRNPLAMLGIAAGGGFLLSVFIHRSPHSHSDGYDEMAFSPPFAERRQSTSASKIRSLLNPLSDTLDNTVAAIMGVASRAVRDSVADVIPNFLEEYRAAEMRRGPKG